MFQGSVESDDVGFDVVPGSTDLGSSNGSLVFVKYIQPNSAAYGKLRYVYCCLQFQMLDVSLTKNAFWFSLGFVVLSIGICFGFTSVANYATILIQSARTVCHETFVTC